MFLFTLIKVVFLNCFYLEEGSNKGINDEFANTEELEKQRVHDEQGRITNSHKEADKQNLECKGIKSDSDEDVSKTGNKSNASSDAEVPNVYVLNV